MHPTYFKNLADLARLPWFEAYDDRVVLSDTTLGPIVDVHTHVALAYVRPMQVDLDRKWERTEHYLPACCPVDLVPYSNRNFTDAQLSTMKKDLTLGSLGPGGMRRTHTIPNLTGEMAELGIRHAVILPIDFPVASDNASHALEAQEKTDSTLLSFGSVHPYSRDVEGKLASQVKRGARGLKVHPNIQMVRPDDPRAMKLYRLCADAKIPVLWHCGPVGIEPALGRYLTQVRHYEAPIRENPATTFVLGHAGALQLEAAMELCRKYPNVYMELSCQGLAGVKTLVERGNPDKLLLGSDWPFYSQALPIARVLLATESRRELRRKIFWDNAADLLRLN
jgi:predicted TIM-barrel fold metal-dependent hydrolase